MNLFKRTTASVALVALVSGVFSTGVSAYDVAELNAAAALAAKGYINTQSNVADYNLDATITRAEIAKVAANVAMIDANSTCAGSFADVSATTPNDWVCGYVEALLANGLIAANANYNPNANLTKAEAVKLMLTVAGEEVDFDAATWQADFVSYAVENGFVSSFSDYNTAATRGFTFSVAAAATTEDEGDDILDQLDDLLNGSDDDVTDTDTDTETPTYTGNGELEVTLNPMSAKSQTIPSSGLVTFGKFDITAGSEDSSVSTLTLERQGLSDRSDISRVYFEKNSKRISSRGSVNIDDQVIVSFTPALSIKAGSTETIELVVELGSSTTTGAEHRFELVQVESEEVSVVTNTMKLGSYAVKTVTFTATDDSDTEINVGDTDVIIGEFELATTGDRDNLFKSVTFRNNGGADIESVFENIGLYNDGTNVSSEVIVDGRDITFIINTEIENGRTENFEIRADLVSTDREADSFELELRNETDLNVSEVKTEFSAPITAATDTMTAYSLVGGQLLLTRDTDYTNTNTVSASTSDVVLLAAKLRVDESITVEDLTMDYTATNASFVDQYRDLKLVVDGRTVSTYTPKSTDLLTGTIAFDGTFLVDTNSTVQVIGNIKNNVSNGATFTLANFVLDNTTAAEMRYVTNDEKITTIAGSVQAVKVTVSAATLLATRNDGLSNETLVSGSRDVELLGFSLRANDVADVKITSLNPTASLSGVTLTNITNVRLYQGTELIKTENDFNFNSLNVVIPKNGSKAFRIVADFDTSVVDNSTISLNLGNTTISARNVESNQLIASADINGVNSTSFTFNDQGELVVSTNSSTRDASIVTPSDSEVDVFTFDLEAKDDTLKLTDLYITQTGTTLDLSNAVRSASISVGGSTVNGAVVSSGVLYFPIGTNSPIMLEKDEVTTIKVNVAFNDSTTRTNKGFKFAIGEGTYAGAVNGSVNGMRVVSDSTGLEITTIDVAGVESDSHLLSRSKPIVGRLAESNSTTAYKFTVSAEANRKISLDSLAFEVKGLVQTGATFTLRKEGAANSISTATGNLVVGGTPITLGSLARDYEVNAGTTITYILEISGVDTGVNVDRTREVTIEQVTYKDDVTVPANITVDAYNVLPTTASTFKY